MYDNTVPMLCNRLLVRNEQEKQSHQPNTEKAQIGDCDITETVCRDYTGGT